MKLSLSINTSSLGFRFLGLGLLGLGGLFALLGLFRRSLWLLAAVLLTAGGALYSKPNTYFVRRTTASVQEQATKTLNMMGWQWSQEHDIISVPALKARVQVRSLGPLTLLSFSFAGEVTKREEYLINTLVKFQRDIHG